MKHGGIKQMLTASQTIKPMAVANQTIELAEYLLEQGMNVRAVEVQVMCFEHRILDSMLMDTTIHACTTLGFSLID